MNSTSFSGRIPPTFFEMILGATVDVGITPHRRNLPQLPAQGVPPARDGQGDRRSTIEARQPSAYQPRFLHARRTRMRLTTGMTMPIHFSGSVHKVQRDSTVNQIVESPSTASAVQAQQTERTNVLPDVRLPHEHRSPETRASAQLLGITTTPRCQAYRTDRLRRAFNRARTVENKAPAEPTSARTTVEFSGESTQPI
jgi:hypothetical protein